MKEIVLTQGKTAFVDDQDFESVSKHSWCYDTGYATTRINGRNVRMHRFLLSPKSTELVDHADGDGLNNTRGNLRLCTGSQNLANSKKPINNTSGFKGVTFSKEKRKWKAEIQINRKGHHLGYFSTPQEAHEKYKEKAIELFGEFSRFE